MRIVNQENDAEIARFDLSEDYSTETAMVFGEVYRHNTRYRFTHAYPGVIETQSAVESSGGAGR